MKIYSFILGSLMFVGVSVAANAEMPIQQLMLAQDTLRTCLSNADCIPGENCVRGKCEMNGGPNRCTSDYDCSYNHRCRNGVCVP